MFGQEVLDAIGAELSATGVGKDKIIFRSAPFLEPGFHSGDRLFGERSTALFAALAVTTDMGSRTQDGITMTKANKFRKTKARLNGQEEKGLIPLSRPGGLVRGGQECLNFRIAEEINQGTVVSFGGHGQDTLNVSRAAGLLKRDVVKEGADRGQAKVAGAGTVAAVALNMIQESADERGAEIIQSG